MRVFSRKRKKKEAFATSSRGAMKRSPAASRKKPPSTTKMPAKAPQVGRALHEASTKNMLDKITRLYRAGKNTAGVYINKVARELGPGTQVMALKTLLKIIDATGVMDNDTEVFLPRAHGPEDSDAGTLGTSAVAVYQNVAGRDIQHYAVGKRITAVSDTEMQAARKLFKETNVITDVVEKVFRGQMFFTSGFNCKGFAQPFTQFTALDTSSTTNPDPVIARDDFTISDYSMFFNISDYYNAMAQCTGDMPTTDGVTGDVDLFYALQSMKMEVEMMNSNSFYPMQVKIYVLKAKIDLGSGRPPIQSYLGNNLTSQLDDRPNVDYLMYTSNTALTENVSDSTIFRSEYSVLPQLTPAMSQNFKAAYTIVSVDKIELNPLDTCTYVLKKEIPHPSSLREIQYHRENGNVVKSGDYGLMIEFQGAQALASPNSCAMKDGTLVSNPVMGLAPSRLRVDVKKSVDISAAAIDSTLNAVGTLSPSSQPTWLNQRNFAPSIDTETATFSYADLNQSGSTISGKFTLPVYTDETLQTGGSIT